MATKRQAGFSAAGSTADTEGERKPAIILGGWHPHQLAENTMKAAKDILGQLEAFCAGAQARLGDPPNNAPAIGE